MLNQNSKEQQDFEKIGFLFSHREIKVKEFQQVVFYRGDSKFEINFEIFSLVSNYLTAFSYCFHPSNGLWISAAYRTIRVS
jgi:hypothetical protein